ncbi:uncharacterized protein [Anoplolepis gracilipes]|uniref:uncharacterized protein n=1 Tax=Anoplolepis gracilipes TaxID=354296 RepID=UPI003B9E62D4
MYRQIWLHENDKIYQRLLWRHGHQIKTLQLNTLTFGVSSSPYLAIRTIHKLVDDEGAEFPVTAQVLKNHLYVDDLLTGANIIDEARAVRDDVTALLSRGGFHIRQWASNNAYVINDVEPDAINSNLMLDKESCLKTLGISWHASNDVLRYSARSINDAERITKRIIFSEIAKIYDPLGILGPVILYAKRLMQNLWRNKLNWDESIPADIHTAWINFTTQLELINDISIERLVLTPDYANVQIHGFCDASQEGYGACIYLRSKTQNREVHCQLLCAKLRVAPLKSTTIPHLELCGALLLAKLHDEVQRAMGIVPDKIMLWSDSTIALHWIRTPPHRLKTFVAHRVAQIQKLTHPQIWRHIKSEDNPADALSRGQLSNALVKNQVWFSGPSWLSDIEDKWYNGRATLEEIPDLKKNICLTTVSHDFEILKKYSSYMRLLRVLTLCLRFRPQNKHHSPLCAKEIDETEIKLMKLIQASSFARELNELTNKRDINKTNIAALNPFIDENGLIRVGGRLKMSELVFPQKYPILLPSHHFLTDLIIRETHEKHYHTGVQTTLSHKT